MKLLVLVHLIFSFCCGDMFFAPDETKAFESLKRMELAKELLAEMEMNESIFEEVSINEVIIVDQNGEILAKTTLESKADAQFNTLLRKSELLVDRESVKIYMVW
ncbi:MAG: hypothetical protein LAT68_12680 [Cyclobacteriaceae bacterium]|nr:hypothetical protein [Cyclobacteriaceae bacterium]MCH8517174.1 hypothetical protein [Cyclobacteriaceae bacterium]